MSNKTTTQAPDVMDEYLKNSPIYGKKSELLETNYNTQKNSINQNKQAALSSASAAHQKMLKYLPEYNAAMGLYGNGASETAYLEADARYRNQQAEIGRDYDGRLAQLDMTHNQNKMDLYTEAQAAWEKEQEQAHSFGYEAIANWSGTAEELKNYYEGLKGKMSDTQYADLTNLYNDKIGEKKQAEEDAKIVKDDLGDKKITNSKPSAYTRGKNFEITLGDTDYKVQIGAETGDSKVKLAMTNSKVGDGEVFVYGGKVYIRSGETAYEVEDRVWSSGNTLLLDALGVQKSEPQAGMMGT